MSEYNTNDYLKDVAFSDAAIPAVNKILEDVFTPYSTITWHRDTDIDIKQGIDITFTDEATQESKRIQAKLLRADKAVYNTFTVGWKRNGGDRNGEFFTTQCDMYLSGYAKSDKGEDGYAVWHLIDFHKFKAWFLKKIAEDKFFLTERLKKSSSTVWFVWIGYCDIPSDCIIASSEPVKIEEPWIFEGFFE